MLKIGTVFSGIGAFEHALERMNIRYEIEFACDNGDVDVLSKTIEDNISSIREEFNELEEMNKKNQFDWLAEKYESAKNRFCIVEDKINKEPVNKKIIIEAYQKYLNTGKMNDNQKKAYNEIMSNISEVTCATDENYEYIKLYLKLESDIKRATGKKILDYIKSEVSISDYKKIVKEVRLIEEELSMLHESIKTEVIREKVFSMKSYKEQKEYVDALYENKKNSNKVRQTYFANYEITDEKYHWNVSFLDGRKFKDKIDIFVGGSPCQSFSLVGKQRGLNDTRGTLFYEFARLVDEIKPKVFIFENVKAILSNDNGKTWEKIKEIFENLGYDWKMSILNAKDYGIPQNRERVFVVGIRKDKNITDFKFPEPIKLESKMQDYLLDNVSGKYYLPEKGVKFVTSEKNLNKKYTQIDGDVQLCQKKNQQFNWHGDFVFVEENKHKETLMKDLEKYFLSEKVKKYVLSSGTKGFYSKPEIDLDIARPLLTTMHKMHRAGVDNYVTTEGRIRKLTPRECLRLMGFCDSFKIVVSDTSAYQQSGNSIVVNVLMAIIEEILKVYPELIGGN